MLYLYILLAIAAGTLLFLGYQDRNPENIAKNQKYIDDHKGNYHV